MGLLHRRRQPCGLRWQVRRVRPIHFFKIGGLPSKERELLYFGRLGCTVAGEVKFVSRTENLPSKALRTVLRLKFTEQPLRIREAGAILKATFTAKHDATTAICRGRRELNSLLSPWRYWELRRGRTGAAVQESSITMNRAAYGFSRCRQYLSRGSPNLFSVAIRNSCRFWSNSAVQFPPLPSVGEGRGSRRKTNQNNRRQEVLAWIRPLG